MPDPSEHNPNSPAPHPNIREFIAIPTSPGEQAAQAVCEDLLVRYPGYQRTFSFGTQGGNDIDLRICFDRTAGQPDQAVQDEIRLEFHNRMREQGITTALDLFFMTDQEFEDGIRDLVELGDVGELLVDGFETDEHQAAVGGKPGDTSMFSLYVFSTMRLLHLNTDVDHTHLLTPSGALDRLVLTRGGAVGWMHYFTARFLTTYLRGLRTEGEPEERTRGKYRERIAKFAARVAIGSALARVLHQDLQILKPELITAVQGADAHSSTDERMLQVVGGHPLTMRLFDPSSYHILQVAGRIRSGDTTNVPPHFVDDAESLIFAEAFQEGRERRPDVGEEADSLTSYGLGNLIRELGERVTLPAGSVLMKQGETGDRIFFVPLKTAAGRPNAGLKVTVRAPDGSIQAVYERTAGRAAGDGALFGLPRSATVTAEDEVEVYSIDAGRIRRLLADPELRAQLHEPALRSREARQLDVLLRYLAREGGIFVRQTLPYTYLADRDTVRELLANSPLAQYHLGRRFHDTLALYQQPDETGRQPVETIAADTEARALFETGERGERFYVVSGGTVTIRLQNGEEVTLQPGEFFGESSMLGLPSTGTAIVSPGSSVLSVDARWFTQFSQGRGPLRGVTAPAELADIQPIDLLYHLAAEQYNRVIRRLSTQKHA